MNKIFFITFVACSVVFSFSAHAQSGKQHRNFDREAFLAKKNAFITAEMGLTPEEAASFIPLCNELQEKMFEAGRECRKLSKDLKHNESATDADYLKVIDECVSVNMKQAQLEKEYYEKFKKILSPKKHIKKTYRVTIDIDIDENMIKQFEKGIVLKDHICCPAIIEVQDTHTAFVTITEGKYHQIKRMFGCFGAKVLELHRITMGKLNLPADISEGCCREITEQEMKLLKEV